jgi:signal transduction histidine kinase
MADEWHIVLNRDGMVLGATDGAPASWVGARLDESTDVPPDLNEAAQPVLAAARHSPVPVGAAVSLPSLPQVVHLTVIDAMPLRRTPTDLRALLRSTLGVMQRQAAAFDVTLSVVVDDQVPASVLLDAEKVGWAATVLVGNSLRYVQHGSRVMPGGSVAVRVTRGSTNPEITIEVQDDGPGIPADRLQSLFGIGPQQTRAGLGLSMVREVVAAHAGRIDVDSDTDPYRHGTTIRLTLPVS